MRKQKGWDIFFWSCDQNRWANNNLLAGLRHYSNSTAVASRNIDQSLTSILILWSKSMGKKNLNLKFQIILTSWPGSLFNWRWLQLSLLRLPNHIIQCNFWMIYFLMYFQFLKIFKFFLNFQIFGKQFLWFFNFQKKWNVIYELVLTPYQLPQFSDFRICGKGAKILDFASKFSRD